MTNPRADYIPIVDRKPLKLPGDARVAVWVIVNVEEWPIHEPMARTVIPPPQGQAILPDVPNWSWHEYGMRVGFWRLRRVFERLGITPTVTLNAKVCQTYPKVVEACLQSGWELNAQSFEQIPMQKLENQREVIQRALDVIQEFSGRRPRGWFGPGLTQSFETIDYLAEAGIEYIGDWAIDDEPVTLKTTSRPIVALPYNFEIHDIVMMAVQYHASETWYTRAMDHFECLYQESAERPKVMSLACHPYLSGMAHRIQYVESAYEEILSRRGVVVWDGAKILDWYLSQRPIR